jgi:Cys-tRNA(Pro)/Cys-tRNA(Cys) deacylase
MADRTTLVTTNATTVLTEAEIPFAVHQFGHDRALQDPAGEISHSLRVDSDRVFKTIVALADERQLVAVYPAGMLVDFVALAAAVGAFSAVEADESTSERVSGYPIDSISPLGQKKKRPVILDISALDYKTIYVSAGQASFSIELAPEDLVRVTSARTAPISAVG